VDLVQVPMTEFHRPSLIDCGAKMTVQGTVAGRACLHSKSSIADALQVIIHQICSLIASITEVYASL